jgi:hypothetical protein
MILERGMGANPTNLGFLKALRPLYRVSHGE